MARPRTVTDDALLAATARVIAAVGPARLTLARVAREAGVSAPTLVQRFGSKRALLLQLVDAAPGVVRAQAVRARRTGASPLATARALLLSMAGMATPPQALVHHLAFLQMDLADPDFHRAARRHALEQERQLAALFSDAMAAGELQHGDATALARTALVVANGALIRWALVRRGTAAECLAAELEHALAPWRTPQRSTRKVTRGARRARRPRAS